MEKIVEVMCNWFWEMGLIYVGIIFVGFVLYIFKTAILNFFKEMWLLITGFKKRK